MMKRSVVWPVAFCLAAWVAPAWAQLSNDVVKIGVATDMASLYSDINGPGAVVAAQMAIEDFGGSVSGKKIELVTGDIQNKADVAATLAGRWYDNENVDVILGAGASSSSIAIQGIAGEKKKVFLAVDPASSDITGKLCNPYTVHWVYDTSALANGTGSAVVKAGGKTWFFLTADYAFGYALQRDVAAVVNKAGGKVLGEVRHPINTNDFSSFLLQAQASKAQIIGLANAGGDTINSIKQAAEFGIVKGGQNLAGLLVFITDIHSLGLQTAQGLIFTESFYWDLNDGTRAWSKRFAAANGGKYPSMVQAGVYSSVLHYLKAVEAAKTDDGSKVIAQMKKMPTDDPLFGKGSIRRDGRKIHPAYLVEVKKPSESKGPYDYYKVRATIPADQAFRPEKDGGCNL
jgi:branched-chain amino acid transport system substrate-binding protein